jgi:formate hydrogenlyase subunit 6/NADH:ubiquinone oxidoreductase subunit I
MRSDESSFVLQIDNAQCVGCAICVDVCPEAALAMGPDDLRPVKLADRCTACGECIRECPTAALTLGLALATTAP